MKKFSLTKHALERIFQRHITPDECKSVYVEGLVIEEYPDDRPFPSKLIVGNKCGRIIHIVVAEDENIAYLITAYEPDSDKWCDNFRKRR